MLQAFIASLTFTVPAGILLAALAQWNVAVGAAAIVVLLTAATLIRAR